AEMDEGAVWEAIIDPEVRTLGEIVWIVDLNRQSLDRVIPDVQIKRLQGMFEAAGWQVLTCPWGRRLEAVFAAPGGQALKDRLMPTPEYQRLLRAHPREVHDRLLAGLSETEAAGLRAVIDDFDAEALATLIRDLGGHDLGQLISTFEAIDDSRPSVVFAYTIKGKGLATEGHPGNHAAQLTEAQMRDLAAASGTDLEDPWAAFDPDTAAGRLCAETAQR